MDNRVKNISIIVGALSLLIIAIAVFNNYLSDKEVNSSNKELNDIVMKEYNEAKAKKDKNTLKFSPDFTINNPKVDPNWTYGAYQDLSLIHI